MIIKNKRIISCILILAIMFTLTSLPASASFSTGDYQTGSLVEGKMYVIRNDYQTSAYVDTNGNYSNNTPAYVKTMGTNNATNALGQTIYSLRKIWYTKQLTSSAVALMSSFAPKLCLYTQDASAAPYYTNLTTFTNNNYQRWIPSYNSNGYFLLETARYYGGQTKYMDLYNSASSSSRLESYTYSSSSQSIRWRFFPAYKLGESIVTYGTSIADGSYDNDYFRTGECTWYCNGRAMEKTGTDIAFSSASKDAGNWYNCVTNLEKGQTIKANSIAVFSGGSYGHVVFVEYIENGYVYFSDANNAHSGLQTSNGAFEVQYDGILERVPVSNFATMYQSSDGMTLTGYLYCT